jgi:hypothetical protein
MTGTPFYLAIAVPIVTKAAMILLLYASINKRLDDRENLWRAEPHRVEEMADAHLTRIAEHLT